MSRGGRERTTARAVVLFTRDLRVHDHEALSAALGAADVVVPLFVLDDDLLRGSCGTPNRVAFLLDCLEDLRRALRERGGTLFVRRGDPVREAVLLARECGASSIHASADATPYALARERRLADACAAEGVELRVHHGVTVVEPGELTPAGGDHYRVFTPYWRAWSGVRQPRPLPAPLRIAVPAGLRRGALPARSELVRGEPSPGLARGGESRARAQLERFARRDLPGYGTLHDDLAAARTSQLSSHLHFGSISPRAVLARALRGSGGTDFARALCWRDFHHQVLAARPEIPHADYRPRGQRWRRDAAAARAWRAGLTGYPIVDAGMRQLAREGYIHNRARLIVASFLTKTLYLDWRLGAAHFASLLSDADVANNVGNWQWVAGTGNDTRPNRVLNPLRQAARFDPDGDYVRRYVPELAAVEGAAVHTPWRLPASERRALRYPPPIVDHEQAAAALRARRR
jgi:deoxyribodipyrimidine photo-lyase